MPGFIGRPIPQSIPLARVARAHEAQKIGGRGGEFPRLARRTVSPNRGQPAMRFLCFVAYLIGFRRILLLVLILMAIAIVQRPAPALRQLAAPMRATPTAPRR